jgi:hypothetical protein
VCENYFLKGTALVRRILQSERNATLLIEVLRSNVAAGRFQLHAFVIMADQSSPADYSSQGYND